MRINLFVTSCPHSCVQPESASRYRDRCKPIALPSLTFYCFGCHLKRRKLLGRRTAAVSAARAARASETPEQTSLRLSRMASRSASRLSTENDGAQTERLASAASTMSARCARLSVEERSFQNSQDAVRVARVEGFTVPSTENPSSFAGSHRQSLLQGFRNTRASVASRASEQPQETAHRRFRNAQSTASARALESPAQTTVRRVRNARSTESARALESPARTTVRRVRNARSTAPARVLECPGQTTVRRVRNARSTASARAAENSEVCRQRLENISNFELL
ncbi:unnamed protein product [Acanthosepion pharaonis]|uniref:Uncharacterized protein n=1 Tax=Acanthosepion pharaonis TaxID=158019 RepID=A0A812C0Q7_ACAPH|nr:unnamed protein product [Sepia pharaonis]